MWVDLAAPDPGAIAEATRVIRAGGVVLYPSDTIYGLGCDPFRAGAVKQIFEMKRRKEDQGVLLLVPDRSWMSQLAEEIEPVTEYLAERFWPGPLTLLLQPSSSVPAHLVGSRGRIGLRCPDSKFLLAWLEALSGPIVSTSANISGTPVPEDLKTLRQLFQNEVDLFIEAGDLKETSPSTVVDTVGAPGIVRRGCQIQEIEKALSQFRKRKIVK
jgi:L-threonylcarbamoyladenylate synthase